MEKATFIDSEMYDDPTSNITFAALDRLQETLVNNGFILENCLQHKHINISSFVKNKAECTIYQNKSASCIVEKILFSNNTSVLSSLTKDIWDMDDTIAGSISPKNQPLYSSELDRACLQIESAIKPIEYSLFPGAEKRLQTLGAKIVDTINITPDYHPEDDSDQLELREKTVRKVVIGPTKRKWK